MTIYIGNKRFGVHKGINVYCGRPSILANPFKIPEHGDRTEVCKLFTDYFHKSVQEDTVLRMEVIRLYKLAFTNDITLICWCFPAQCHCETIKKFIDEKLKLKQLTKERLT